MPIAYRHHVIDITATALAYAAGEVVGGLLQIPNFFNSMPGQSEIRRVRISDAEKKGASFTLHIFNQQPATPEDDGDPFDLDPTDFPLCDPSIFIGEQKTYSGFSGGYTDAKRLVEPVETSEAAASKTLFAQLVIEVATTWTNADSLKLGIWSIPVL